ncbi:MAG TPA: hypothetical protein VFG68_09975 [Fimbriiglobus sp.]|nr:hypothetical protein [Fimbriiglobus sp.]
MKIPQPRTPKQKLIAALLAALAAFVGYLLSEQGIKPPPPPQEPPRSFGWVPDPAAVAAVKAALPCPEFRATEAFAAEYDGPDDVYLWDACRKATGDLLPPRDQRSVGSCIAFGTASAIEHLLCVQIASGAAEEYRDLAQEVIYGGSRVEVGGGRIRGDGSVGAWAAKFVRQYGVVPRGVHGSHDLTDYDERRCREYGARGVPDDLEPVARQHPVRSVANVTSWDECRAALRNGYPVAVCSSQGFTMQRDADGFCRPQGTWMHCLTVVGVRGGRRPGGFLLNSWGPDAHTGPLGPGNPSPAGFWCDAGVLDRMLAEGDSWAFSSAVGFPARKLDWYAMRKGQGAWGKGREVARIGDRLKLDPFMRRLP